MGLHSEKKQGFTKLKWQSEATTQNHKKEH